MKLCNCELGIRNLTTSDRVGEDVNSGVSGGMDGPNFFGAGPPIVNSAERFLEAGWVRMSISLVVFPLSTLDDNKEA